MVYKFTTRAKKAIEIASKVAQELGHNYIGTEHILYGLISDGAGVASKVLQNQGINSEEIKEFIHKMNYDNEKNNLFFEQLNNKYQKVVKNDYIDLNEFNQLTNKEKRSLLYLYLENYLGEYLKKISKRRLIDLVSQIENTN